MNEFWRNKSVLVTGHTGFKGGWLVLWLTRLGARVSGLSLPPDVSPSLYEQTGLRGRLEAEALVDLRDRSKVREFVASERPEIVFHLAAQPLVRRSYRQPYETFETNVLGTASLLDAILDVGSSRVVLCITSDKCYQNRNWVYPYRESDRLGGHDPYSASKAATELLVASYRASFATDAGMSLATARAGNVIGGGDWAEDRLVPDCVRAFIAGQSVELRYPEAIRPWQHVLDPLAGYMQLAQAQSQQPQQFSSAWNFGPHSGSEWTVEQLVNRLAGGWPGGALWHTADNAEKQLHEHQLLRLDISQTCERLGWHPGLNAQQSLDLTLEWYRQWYRQGDLFDAEALCLEQIEGYIQRINSD